MTPKDINANYSACVVGEHPICSQPEKINPIDNEGSVSLHKKLTRIGVRNAVSISSPVNEQPESSQSIAKFETKIIWTSNKDAKVSLRPKQVSLQEYDTPMDSIHEEPYIFSRQAYRDVPYYSEYESTNMFASLFGYNTKNWFNGIIGCLKPFWGIIGQKETSQEPYCDEWEIPFEQIRELQWLGSGAQGAVFMGLYCIHLYGQMDSHLLVSFQANSTANGLLSKKSKRKRKLTFDICAN